MNPKSLEDVFAEDNGKRRKTILSRSTSFASKSSSSIAKDRKSRKGDESPTGSPPHLSPTSFGASAVASPLSNSFEVPAPKRKRKIKSMLRPKESKNVDIVRNFVGPGSLSFADIAQRAVFQSREDDEDNFSLDNTCADQTEEEFLEEEPLAALESPLSSPRKGGPSPCKFDCSGQEDTQCSENLQIRQRRGQKKKGGRFLQRASVISNLLQNRPTKDELEEKTAIFPDHQKKQDTMTMLSEFLDYSLSSYSCNTTESDCRSEFDDTQSDQSQIGHWSSDKGGVSRSNLSVESFPSPDLTPRDPFGTPRDPSFCEVRRDSNSTFSSSSCSSSSSARLASSSSSSRHTFSEEFFKAVDGRTIEYQCIEIDRPVGRGKFGTVFKGKWKGREVAVKRLQLSSFAQTEKSFLREVSALRKAEECRSIVNMIGVCCCPCAIVMELWEGGSLYDMIHIRKHKKTSLIETLRILSDVAEALRFLHDSLSPAVIHRDVTTRNILLRKRDERLEACLADFGIATTTKKKGAPMSPIGRLRYMAPEVTDKVYTKKADEYMFGNVIYEIVVRQKPFSDLSAEEAARSRKRGEIPEIPETCPKRFAELMQDCWEFKPKDRPNMKEICRRLGRI